MGAHNALDELNKEAEIAHNGKILDFGNDVPSDGVSGFATGCLFCKTNGGNATALHVNEGTAASANFNAIIVGT